MRTAELRKILPEDMLGVLQTVEHYKRGKTTIQGTDSEAITARCLDRALHELATALLARQRLEQRLEEARDELAVSRLNYSACCGERAILKDQLTAALAGGEGE